MNSALSSQVRKLDIALCAEGSKGFLSGRGFSSRRADLISELRDFVGLMGEHVMRFVEFGLEMSCLILHFFQLRRPCCELELEGLYPPGVGRYWD